MPWFKKKTKKTKSIMLDEWAFTMLVNGGMVVINDTRIALQDIGFRQMLEAIDKAASAITGKSSGNLPELVGFNRQKDVTDEMELRLRKYVDDGHVLKGILGTGSIDPVFLGGFQQGLRVAIGMIGILKGERGLD